MASSETSPLIYSKGNKAPSLWTKIRIYPFALVLLTIPAWFMSFVLVPQLHISTPDKSHDVNPTKWSWEDIEPSAKLTWHKCYENLDCARLQVPLDWLEVKNASTMVVAVIRKNATSHTDYKGPLFLNPGGPGGSGVELVQSVGHLFHTMDIVSFDPRGVGATTPQLRCFKGPQAQQLAALQILGTVDSHPGVIYDKYAYQTLASLNCERNVGDLARFVGTASVARDMLEINEQLGYKKIRYWGLSYGTLLGGTFAAMYPDRIERMVNDGNVDYSEWYNGTTGIHYCEDTDKVMAAFFELCSQAGPSQCAFHEPTASAVEDRLNNLYARLRKYPLIAERNYNSSISMAAESSTKMTSIINYSSVKSAVIFALYQPILNFPHLAEILSDLEAENGISFLERFGAPAFNCCGISGCAEDKWPLEATGNIDADLLVRCGESRGEAQYVNVEQLVEYNEELKETSPMSGPVMFDTALYCVGWKPRAKWIFTGPFKVNTSYPILFIGNMADNITPLGSAIRNSKNFDGSSVLIQDSYGHTSISTPSKCTAEYRLAYFQNGTLPINGTVCEADIIPFGLEVKAKGTEGDMDRAMRGLMGITVGKGWV